MYVHSFNRLLNSNINMLTIKNIRIHINRSYVKCYEFDPYNYDRTNIGVIYKCKYDKKNIDILNNNSSEIDKSEEKMYQIIYTDNLIILENNKKMIENIKNLNKNIKTE